jgi:hypothetical protein
MPYLRKHLDLDRCPHCSIDHPNLEARGRFESVDHSGRNRRFWSNYICARCGGAIVAAATAEEGQVIEIYPRPSEIVGSIPERARHFLKQATESIHAPSASVVVSAAAVDAMLKELGYKDGSLYRRIEKAASDHLITAGMAKWAHAVRLDANDQRHADDGKDLPLEDDARRVLSFALALAQFLFVLPDMVERGLTSEV